MAKAKPAAKGKGNGGYQADSIQVLKGLEDIGVDDIEGRIVEYGSPVPRRFLDHPHRCRIRFGHDSSSFKVQASGTGL